MNSHQWSQKQTVNVQLSYWKYVQNNFIMFKMKDIRFPTNWQNMRQLTIFLQPFYKGVSTFRQLLIKVEMFPQNYTLVNSSQSRKRTLLAFLCLLIAMPLGTLTAVIMRSRAAFTPEYMHCFIGLLWVNDEVINVLVWFFFRLFKKKNEDAYLLTEINDSVTVFL